MHLPFFISIFYYTVEPRLSVFAINRTHSSENLKIIMDCRHVCSYNRTFYIT